MLSGWQRAGLALLIVWALIVFCLLWALFACVVDRLWARLKRRRYATHR